MKLFGLALLVVFALAFAACGGSSHVASVAKVTTNAEVKQDLSKGEAIVKSCITKGNLLSKSGRQKVIACIAPPGHKAALEQCAQTATGHDGFLTSSKRKKLYKDLALCVEKNR